MYNHVKKGIFIGYTVTSYQIYYWYMYTKLVNISKHVHFDEVMNYLEVPTPNYRHMSIALGSPLSEDQEEAPISMPTTLDSQHTPFPMIHDMPVGVICDHDTLGIIIGSDVRVV